MNFLCMHTVFCSVDFVASRSGVQLGTEAQISGVHSPYFRYWRPVYFMSRIEKFPNQLKIGFNRISLLENNPRIS